jgi:hypothetical protein
MWNFMGETKGDNFKRGVVFLLSYGVIFATVTGPVTLLVSGLDTGCYCDLLTDASAIGCRHLEIRLCKKSGTVDGRHRPYFVIQQIGRVFPFMAGWVDRHPQVVATLSRTSASSRDLVLSLLMTSSAVVLPILLMALLNGIVVPILVEYLAEYKGEVGTFYSAIENGALMSFCDLTDESFGNESLLGPVSIFFPGRTAVHTVHRLWDCNR